MPPSTAIMPYLTYDDPKAAIEWLKEAFGIEELDVTVEDDGSVGHAELKVGSGIIMLTASAGTAAFPLRSPQRSGFASQGVFVRLDRSEDVDQHYERAVAAGAKILFELADQPYGSREYTCQDPEGHVWSFGTYNPGQDTT